MSDRRAVLQRIHSREDEKLLPKLTLSLGVRYDLDIGIVAAA